MVWLRRERTVVGMPRRKHSLRRRPGVWSSADRRPRNAGRHHPGTRQGRTPEQLPLALDQRPAPIENRMGEIWLIERRDRTGTGVETRELAHGTLPEQPRLQIDPLCRIRVERASEGEPLEALMQDRVETVAALSDLDVEIVEVAELPSPDEHNGVPFTRHAKATLGEAPCEVTEVCARRKLR